MRDILTPRYRARLAETAQDVQKAQRLRHLAFRGAQGVDSDRFDVGAQHILIETLDGAAKASFRLRLFAAAVPLTTSYAAQFYELSGFARQSGPKAEVGRFCLDPAAQDPDLLRLCWAALAQIVLGQGVQHLFGASSFPGADPGAHAAALAWLGAHALGPAALRPTPLSTLGVKLTGHGGTEAGVPALLRFYLGLGGWVADHAMIDRDLDTLHIFTALDLARMPPARARAFAAMALPR